ncbi:MAG: CvpA family protein [Alphaproteobacteria bacterium]|nr:CvpA family protein [Alphaproteobacteria bacterium]
MIADIVVAGVLLISGVLAFSMGLVKFLLLIVSWGGAALTAFYSFPHLSPYLEGLFDSSLIRDGVAATAVFVLTLVVLTIVTHMISSRVRGSVLGHLDRALGFVFGLVLGMVLVSLIYVGATLFWDENDFPEQIADAKTLPLIRSGAEALVLLLPAGAFTRIEPDADGFDDAVEDVESAVRGLATDKMDAIGETLESIEAEDRLRKLTQPQPPEETESPADEPAAEAGYGDDQRSDMQRLIESNQ